MIKKFKDINDLSKYAADSFIEIANQSIAERGRFLVSLAGGNTPMRLYQMLGDFYKDKLDWTRAHFFWGDERCVPIDDAGNNYGQAKKVLFDKIGATNIHRVLSELAPAEAAQNYAQTLKRFADNQFEFPRFDLVLLGMGDDGHTASLFPNSPINAVLPALAVTANYQDRPANRVTLTQNVFNSSRNVLFLVSGKAKAVTLSRVLSDIYVPEELPAQRIKPIDGKLIWLVDEEAGSLL
ncbi:MAG: 6-phosphogluconolactonase [Anaerolineales bacterium]|nr:6-phosphogluconolactonase [Anaerolineales bacterium]